MPWILKPNFPVEAIQGTCLLSRSILLFVNKRWLVSAIFEAVFSIEEQGHAGVLT